MSTLSPLARIFLVCVVCAAGAVPAQAQAPGPGGSAGQGEPVRLAEADFEAVRLTKIVTAVRIPAGMIALDGRLDEAAWALASPGGGLHRPHSRQRHAGRGANRSSRPLR